MQPNNKSVSVIEVISSNKLSDKQKTEIEKKSMSLFGIEKADYRYLEDNSLIGGFILKSGSRILDLSVKGKLDNLLK